MKKLKYKHPKTFLFHNLKKTALIRQGCFFMLISKKNLSNAQTFTITFFLLIQHLGIYPQTNEVQSRFRKGKQVDRNGL